MTNKAVLSAVGVCASLAKMVVAARFALVLAFTSLLGATNVIAAPYTPGFTWAREADWTPGTTNDSTAGNPDDDSLGNPTWRYERAIGGPLGSANVWYAQARSALVWRNGQWRVDSADRSPAIAQDAMSQADINFTFDSPIARWQNPTGVTQLVDVSVDTDVISFRADSGSTDLELAVVRLNAATSTFDLLWSETRNAPHNSVLQPGAASTLFGVSVAAGDSVLFTYRNLLDSPRGGNGSTAWVDASTVTIVPEPASVAVLGLCGLLLVRVPRRRMTRERCCPTATTPLPR